MNGSAGGRFAMRRMFHDASAAGTTVMRLVVSFGYGAIRPVRNPTRGSGLGGVIDIDIPEVLADADDPMEPDDDDLFILHAAERSTPMASGADKNLVYFTVIEWVGGTGGKQTACERARYCGTVASIFVMRSISVV